jgi:HK97 gp10 family phage protein
MAVIEVKGLKELKRTLERIPEQVRSVLEDLTRETYEKAVQYAPERTGFLRRNIRMSVEGLTGRVISQAPYSAYVEFGTRPHMIFPRRARALRFEVGGRTVFARYVHHPGTRGQFFMRRALQDALNRLSDFFRARLHG